MTKRNKYDIFKVSKGKETKRREKSDNKGVNVMDYMDISEIRTAWDNGEYIDRCDIPSKVKDGHVFDENLSVKRNREMAQEWNENVIQMTKAHRERQGALYQKFTNDVVNYLMGVYGFNELQARKIEGYVYAEKHSFMCDYFGFLDEFADVVQSIIEAK